MTAAISIWPLPLLLADNVIVEQDYSKLGVLKRQFSTVPILALTATATPRLVADVKSILEIEKCTTFRTSFFRSNLHYEVQTPPRGYCEC